MELFADGIAWLTDPANWTHPRNGIFLRLWEHVSLSVVALAVAVRSHCRSASSSGTPGEAAGVVIAIANIGRAVPSVGWLGIVFAPLLVLFGRGGIGFLPAVIALILLAIPPIVTNTYAGMREVDREMVEAGRGMGMRESQIVRLVEVPVALPVIMAGVRSSAVQVVATATLATIVGGGTLGAFIVQGIEVRALDRVVGAAILVALLAIFTELAFGLLQRRAVSPGLRARASHGSAGSHQDRPAGRSERARIVARKARRGLLLDFGLPIFDVAPGDTCTESEGEPNADPPHACPRGGGAGARDERLLAGREQQPIQRRQWIARRRGTRDLDRVGRLPGGCARR